MATELIPFGNLEEGGYDELAGGSPRAFNVLVDARATMRRRPGIVACDGVYSGTINAGGIYGVHVTNAGQVFAVGPRTGTFNQAPIYAVSATAAVEISHTLNTKLYGAGRPVFTETEMLLCVCAGNEIKRITHTDPAFPIDVLGMPAAINMNPSGAPNVMFVSGVSFASVAQLPASPLAAAGMQALPPFSTHTCINSSRLLANDSLIDKTKVRYSDPNTGTTDFSGHDTWTPGANTSGFFTAEANPDPVVALFENTNELFAFGSRSLQVFGPDPQLVFSTSSAIELGCGAPYSVVKRNQGFWWLDSKRRFVFSDGRAFDESIGNPVRPAVEGFATVSDCYGFSVIEGTVDTIVWVCPSAGRSFCYQPGVGWGEWAGWDDQRNNWTTLPITAHHQSSVDAVNLVGTADGRIGKLTRTASTDFGTRIRAYVETGFLDRGTSAKKRTREVRLTMRRGQTTGSSATGPLAYLSYRDSLGGWSSPLTVRLGTGSEFGTVIPFRNVGGPYRTRQWRFEFDGDDELVLVKVEEDFTVLSQVQE